jgi:hypothetical protein
MLPCDGPTVCPPQGAPPQTPLEKFLRFATVGTMLMTAPQVWTIWAAGNVSGVSSIAWLAYGIKKQDALICFANAGWIGMDLAIIAGIMVRQ